MWAVLLVGLFVGCDSGGGGDKPDADEEDTGEMPIRTDGGRDGGSPGLDGGEDADVPCEPKSCDDQGFECGEAPDGCGGTLDCGDECVDPDDDSTAYFTCGGGGEEYKCGCKAKTCDDALLCGTLSDGCGGELDCGDPCTGHDSCGGGGTVNACGCAPELAACGNAECGTADDGCGSTVNCGQHDGGCADGRTCNANKICECKPQAELCEGRCGPQNIDGCAVNCGACTTTCTGQACTDCTCPGAGAVCANDLCCTPQAKATTCGTAVCGSKTNNCGETVDCGQCAGGQQCTNDGQCVDPRTAALVGTYAVHSVGFAVAAGQVSRSESLAWVTITSSGGVLNMKEQGCWSAAYLKSGSTESKITEVLPVRASHIYASNIALDLQPNLEPEHQSLPETKEWVRGKAPPDQNTLGWRRGRPSFCPARTSSTDEPDANPAGGPSPDPVAIGPMKPWLKGALCLCPEQEVRKRGLCSGLTGTARNTCIDAWAQNDLPYQRKQESPDIDVTDCRVVDDDADGLPGVTGNVTSTFASAEVHSATNVANIMWGKIDLSGAKRHWGVVEDQPELASSNIACKPTGGFGSVLCGTSQANICPGYVGTVRGNPVEFVPLKDSAAPQQGWNCQTIYDNRASLFGTEVWQPSHWLPKYPPATPTGPNAVCKPPTP